MSSGQIVMGASHMCRNSVAIAGSPADVALRESAYLRPGDVFPTPEDPCTDAASGFTDGGACPQRQGQCDGQGCCPPSDRPPDQQPPAADRPQTASPQAYVGTGPADQCSVDSPEGGRQAMASQVASASVVPGGTAANAQQGGKPTQPQASSSCPKQPPGHWRGPDGAVAAHCRLAQPAGRTGSQPQQSAEGDTVSCQQDGFPSVAYASPEGEAEAGEGAVSVSDASAAGISEFSASRISSTSAAVKPPLNKLLDYIRWWSVKRCVVVGIG